ncbi:MAG TPA: TIR domain-containing protein [Clostridiales bacterium]|nr:TIR domain-containing protein [Clostridiales bacterium]HQP70273.1 TIR domain-containing protein [Clostridiales bacterium]
MKKAEPLNLFISYSHLDEDNIKEFVKFIAPLKSSGLIKEWYDRRLFAGQEFQDNIDNNLDNADIICFFISANCLDSSSCIKEIRKGYELYKKKGIIIIPIILSPCGWLDVEELNIFLALPTDGKPISYYLNQVDGWMDVYEGIKKSAKAYQRILSIENSNHTIEFLNSAELLSKAHSNKNEVFLDDIYTCPYLTKYDELKDKEKKVKLNEIINEIIIGTKLLIAGQDQSGKTTICKRIYTELKKRNFLPVYVQDRNGQFEGLINNRIKDSFNEQYDEIKFEDIDRKYIIPIIDDFHFAKKKEKHVDDLKLYATSVIIVDDIFSLNFRDEELTAGYKKYTVNEFTPSMRNELIEKWIHLSDNKTTNLNEFYKRLDSSNEVVNSTLGKIMSNGIMPSYPFFILSIISTYEALDRPLDQEITSQGYCYQALIYMYLRKEGVKNDDIDTYINFLSEIAYHFHSNKIIEISENEFDEFIKRYSEEYIFTIHKNVLLNVLKRIKIIIKDSFGNYSFNYHYLYYYFVAKFLAENLDDNKILVDEIINNLHKDENAYIAIFMSHHSKSLYVIDEIERISITLYDSFKPATLSSEELDFFDEKLESIIEASLPKVLNSEKARKDKLKAEDQIEVIRKEYDDDIQIPSEIENDIIINLRKSLKTVEVLGRILKNRVGSFKKEKIESIFLSSMNLQLRILSSFIEIIKNDDSQSEVVDFLQNKLLKSLPGIKNANEDKLKKLATDFFWNMNFAFIGGLIDKTVHSLGSDKLYELLEKINTENDTPVVFLIRHGILMWYNKNLNVEEIFDRLKNDDFSETARRVVRYMIVHHCMLHHIEYKDKQRIEQKLGIPTNKLIQIENKSNDQ